MFKRMNTNEYNANIEFAQTIAREGIFLMELLTDVSHVAIPVENLKRTIRQDLQAMGIHAIFQDQQVFNKRKRIILFHRTSSFLDQSTIDEILRQTQVDPREVTKVYDVEQPVRSLQNAASRLDGLPMDVVDTVLRSITPAVFIPSGMTSGMVRVRSITRRCPSPDLPVWVPAVTPRSRTG